MGKLKFKDVYEKVNHNPYCQVTNILKKFEIKSSFKNLLNNYGKIILLTIIIVLAVLTFTFWNNIEIILCSVGILLLLFIMAIIYNTYKINLTEESLIYKMNMQTTSIPYQNLINIYLNKKKVKIFFIPIPYYTINIVHIADEERVNILSFPTVMLNKKDILMLFSCFELKEYENKIEKTKKHN